MRSFRKSAALGILILWGMPLGAFAQEEVKPSDVVNVVAEPGDGSVTVSWEEATDEDGIVDEYFIFWGTTPVVTEDDAYEDQDSVGGDESTFTVSGLENGTKYFFAVLAVDDEGNESENYSVEVSATPEGGTPLVSTDTSSETLAEGAPYVVTAEQITNNQVLVTMSELVSLLDPEEAFIVENKGTDELVAVERADANLDKVTITVAEDFTEGTLYKIIATTSIEDVEGNPVSSGLTDFSEFTARYIAPVVEVPETPEVPESVSEPEVAPEPEISEVPDFNPVPESNLPITPIPLVEGQEPLMAEPDKPAPPKDLVAPINASSLTVDSSRLQAEKVVVVNWEPSLNLDKDVADQVLYTKIGGGPWDDGYSIGKDVSQIEMEVDMDESYEVRIVTVDRSGNESSGTSLSFSTELTESGPGTVVSLILVVLFLFSLFLFGGRKVN